MRDRQTTGGYPKIATVISADLDRLAQSMPGTELTFRAIAQDEGSPEQKFRRSVDAFLAFVEQAPDAARVLLTVPTGDPVAASVSREVQTGASAGIAALLAESMPARTPWHLQATAAFLKEGLHAVAVWWLDHPGPSRAAVADIVLDAAWRGLQRQMQQAT